MSCSPEGVAGITGISRLCQVRGSSSGVSASTQPDSSPMLGQKTTTCVRGRGEQGPRGAHKVRAAPGRWNAPVWSTAARCGRQPGWRTQLLAACLAPCVPVLCLTWRSSSAAVRKVRMLSRDRQRHSADTDQPPRLHAASTSGRQDAQGGRPAREEVQWADLWARMHGPHGRQELARLARYSRSQARPGQAGQSRFWHGSAAPPPLPTGPQPTKQLA